MKRVERRTRWERVEALRESLRRFIEKTKSHHEHAPPIRGPNLARLQYLHRQIMKTAAEVRRDSSGDRAWEFFDKDMQKFHEHIEDGSRYRPPQVSSYAIYPLRQSVDMILGTLERAKPSPIPGVDALIRAMFWSESAEERSAAREVLADAIEGAGRVGEANAIRARRWLLDVKALASLGIRTARHRPSRYP